MYGWTPWKAKNAINENRLLFLDRVTYCDPEMAGEIFNELVRLYSAEGRHYHALHHVFAMLDRWKETSWSSDMERTAVFIAIWFHDAIYDTGRKDNEAQSATLLRDFIPSMEESQKNRITSLILGTRTHEAQRDDEDFNKFLDIDLSFLADPYDLFVRDSDDIRKEYLTVYSPELWETGRKAFLHSLLAKEHLYCSEWGRAKFEQAARGNLRRALDDMKKEGAQKNLEDAKKQWSKESDDELLGWVKSHLQGCSDDTCNVCVDGKAVMAELRKRLFERRIRLTDQDDYIGALLESADD